MSPLLVEFIASLSNLFNINCGTDVAKVHEMFHTSDNFFANDSILLSLEHGEDPVLSTHTRQHDSQRESYHMFYTTSY